MTESDLRLPLITAVIGALTVSALTRLDLALAGLALSILLAFARRVGLRAARHRLAHVEGFLIVLLVMLPFTTPGQPLLDLGPLTASVEGMARALLIAVKVNTVALLLLSLLGRGGAEHLGRALVSLGLPAAFVRLMDMILRHSHTARASFDRQAEAMRARAFRPRATLHGLRSYGYLMGGALLRAFDRAERVDEAMRMRGGGPVIRAHLPALPARRIALIAAMAALALCITLLDRGLP